jgi:hypothetical protein
MMLCTRCGASNQPASKFCLSCGAPLPASGAGQAAGPAGTAQTQQPPAPQQGPPPQGPPPGYAPPAWGPPPHQYAPPPGAWQQQGYPAPPPGGAPQPQHPHAAPPNPWGPPPEGGGFAPAAPDNRMVVGSPQGLNPFGATMGPDAYQGPPPGAPPAAAPGHGPPQVPPQASPSPWGPPPQGPPAGWGSAVPAQPAPAPLQHANTPSQARSHDPSAFAATAPPPDPPGAQRASQPPGGAPPAAAAARSEASFVSTPGSEHSARPGSSSPVQRTSLIPGRDPELVEPSAPRALAGFLVSYEQSEIGVFWPLYQGQNVIGRKGAAQGLDIEIDHPTTSSRHAVIYASARPGRLKIEDPGSTNGTFVADAMLERGKKHELRDGDALRFGGFSVIVKVI